MVTKRVGLRSSHRNGFSPVTDKPVSRCCAYAEFPGGFAQQEFYEGFGSSADGDRLVREVSGLQGDASSLR